MVVALAPFASSIESLPAPLTSNFESRYGHIGCPEPFSELRLLTVSHWGFDGKVHTGQLVVNRDVAAPLAPRRPVRAEARPARRR
jgi:hypothetical protein